MYAYVLETGRRSFEGVFAPSNTTAHLHDPPPPTHNSRIAPANSSCSKNERDRPHSICPVRSFCMGAYAMSSSMSWS